MRLMIFYYKEGSLETTNIRGSMALLPPFSVVKYKHENVLFACSLSSGEGK